MMYGFGDDLHPLPQSVALVEDMAVDYLHQVLRRASDAAAERQRGGGGGAARVQERDLLFAVRKDAKRVARLQELLDVYEEQKERGRTSRKNTRRTTTTCRAARTPTPGRRRWR